MSQARPALLVALLLLAACGSEKATVPHTLPAPDDRVPITQRAVAAIALAHLADGTSDRRAMDIDRQHPEGLVGAELRYGASAGEDGDLLRVVVASGKPETDPCELSQCVDLETDVKDATLVLRWEEEVPESDPGVVSVLLQRDGEYAYVYLAGPTITADPRDLDLDLSVSVDEMTAVVEDPWLRLDTSPAAVEAGEEVEDWESDDLEFGVDDPVPNTDLGLLAAYLDFEDSGVPYVDHRSSPLTSELGPDAIGGRMTIPPDNGYIFGDEQVELDILAAPDPAAWLGGDPCADPAFAGHCHRYRGTNGPVYLAWRAAAAGDPGLVWVGNVREDEVVAIRIRGFQVPQKRLDLEDTLGLFTFQDQLDNNQRLGRTTDQEVLDAASGL